MDKICRNERFEDLANRAGHRCQRNVRSPSGDGDGETEGRRPEGDDHREAGGEKWHPAFKNRVQFD